MARMGSSKCSMTCDMWMRENRRSSSGQGYRSRFHTWSAADSADMSMPTASGSILRLPHPISKVIVINDSAASLGDGSIIGQAQRAEVEGPLDVGDGVFHLQAVVPGDVRRVVFPQRAEPGRCRVGCIDLGAGDREAGIAPVRNTREPRTGKRR